MLKRNQTRGGVSLLRLCVLALAVSFWGTAGIFAVQLPSIEDLIAGSKAAHEACRKGMSTAHQGAGIGTFAKPQGGTAVQECYDARYYNLAMTFDQADSLMTGNAEMTAQVVCSIDRCELNGNDELHVDSVWLDGALTSFLTIDTSMISVDLQRTYLPGETFAVRVFYHGVRSELDGWCLEYGTFAGEPVVGSLAKPYWARSWWPCKDYPHDKADSLDISITYPAERFAASVGKMISDVDNGNGLRTTHWAVRYPVSTYQIGMSMAEFTYWREWALRTPTDSLPVDFWAYPSQVVAVQTAFSFAVPAIDTFARIFGPYPFLDEKFALAQSTWPFTLDHQGLSLLGPTYSQNPMGVVHEVAHQWWGNMVTSRNWQNGWLNEGFATYAEALFIESIYGSDSLQVYMLGKTDLDPGAVYIPDSAEWRLYFDPNLYDKGAWVLHMLRGLMGDADFFSGLQAYATSSAQYATATTEDFQGFMEQASALDLDWFFQDWVYGTGVPEYVVRRQCLPDGLGDFKLDLVVEQAQASGGDPRMLVQFDITTTATTYRDTLWLPYGVNYFQLNFPDSVTSIVLDPDHWVLCTAEEQSIIFQIVPSAVPEAVANQPYHHEMLVLGGVAPYSWSLLGGDLPNGVTFTGGSSGALDGTPDYPATYHFTLQVTDSDVPPSVIEAGIALNVLPGIMHGDANGDTQITVSDVVYLINYIFAGGPTPVPLAAGDVNCSGTITISDAVYLIQFIFAGGPAPCL